ncbi:MAG: cache domain-containing protein [Methanoregula sp.]|nr:cache domain-containing protein [Methanoregula sp.]
MAGWWARDPSPLTIPCPISQSGTPVRSLNGACPIVIILIACLIVAGCTGPSGPGMISPATTPLPVPPKGTAVTVKDLIAFVDAAAVVARQQGKENALATFNDPNSSFNRGELYVFSEGMDGTALAEPFEHEIVGKNILYMTDPYGIPLVENLVDTARQGRGLVSYNYRNPSRNYTIEPKVSYVVNVDGTYYVGAGYYENLGTTFPAAGLAAEQRDVTAGELVTFVRGAAEYAKKEGKEQAAAAFQNTSGPFVKGELYVIAYDFNERNIAHPYSPWIANLSLKHYTDQDSVATIAGLSDLARRGGGFAHTTQRIPAGGNLIFAPKLHYVLPVDGTWWVSASILNPDYTRLRSGNLTGIRIRNHTQEELYTLVDRAVRFARENEKERTLAEIGKPDGMFVDGDLFVWAEGFDGTILADPFIKGAAGNNFLNYTDAYGEKTTLAGISALRNGTGFVHGMFPDTTGGSGSPVPKLICMKAVDDRWWIGSGIYGIEVR